MLEVGKLYRRLKDSEIPAGESGMSLYRDLLIFVSLKSVLIMDFKLDVMIPNKDNDVMLYVGEIQKPEPTHRLLKSFNNWHKFLWMDRLWIADPHYNAKQLAKLLVRCQ
jgi:hypothetical protein